MQKHSRAAAVPSNTLEGKTILITRRAEQADDFVSEIERRGGRAVVIPLIHISEPESWRPCDAALENLPAYAGIIFTSRNGVEKFFGRLREKKIEIPSAIAVYAVGQRTAEAIGAVDVAVTRVPKTFTAAALADLLTVEKVRGKKYLLPGGNLNASDLEAALTQRGAEVTSVEVYRNTMPDEVTVNDLRERFSWNEFDVITFASSSAVRNFVQVISPSMISQKTKIAVIGPSTKQTAQALYLPVAIEPKQSTAIGLVEAITEFYSNPQS